MLKSKRIQFSPAMCAGAAAIAAITALAPVNTAQAYPDQPVELVVSYAAGGISDLMARSYAKAAEKHLDGSIVVQNRPGAAGIIGTNHVFNAKPDGHTLLLARIAVLAVAPALQKVPYDPDKFTYVGLIAKDPYACVTGTRKPYKSLNDLKAAIKEKKGAVTYSSSGVGSLNQFGALRLLEALDVGDAATAATHIPNAGEGPALTAVAGGHIDFFCGNVAPILPQIKSGTVRGLLVTSDERIPGMDDVPTAAELGLPELSDIVGWSAIVGPPDMAPEAVEKLGEAMQKMKSDSEWTQMVEKLGSIPTVLSPQETKDYVAKQRKIYSDIAQRLNLKK